MTKQRTTFTLDADLIRKARQAVKAGAENRGAHDEHT